MSATVRDPAPVWPEDRTEDKPKPERRKETRRRVLKGAQIAFKGRGAVIDCMVRDLSDGGACLKVASPIGIPDTFENSQEDRDYLFADLRHHQRSRFTLSVAYHGPPLRVWWQGYRVFFTICG